MTMFPGSKAALAFLVDRERVTILARTLGVSDEDFQRMAAEVETEHRVTVCDFDCNAEICRRLMETYAALSPRPTDEAREAARQILLSQGMSDHPALVDRWARNIDALRQCRAEYQRPGGRQPGDRIVGCHLPAGHPGEHEDEEAGTWTDGTA